MGRPRAVLRRRDRLRGLAGGVRSRPAAVTGPRSPGAYRRGEPRIALEKRRSPASRGLLPLILAFDTATDVATSALVDDGEVLGERCRARDAARGRRRARCGRPGRGRATWPASRSDRSGQLHRPTARPRGRARPRARARYPRRRHLDARRARGRPFGRARRSSTPSDARSSLRGEPRVLRPAELGSSRARPASATAPFRYRAALEAAGAEVPPDGSDGICREPAFTPGSPPDLVGLTGRSRSTSALPDAREGVARTVEIRPLAPRRPGRDRGDRAHVDADAVVEVDVRRRAPKPTSFVSADFRAERRWLHGYMIVSRYVDAWHVMNIVSLPSSGDAASRRTCSSDLFERDRGRMHRGYTLEVRVSNEVGSRSTSHGFRARGSAAATTGQPRGRADHVRDQNQEPASKRPSRSPLRPARLDPGFPDVLGRERRPRSCTEDSHDPYEDWSQSQADLPARRCTRRQSPRIASRRHLELVRARWCTRPSRRPQRG